MYEANVEGLPAFNIIDTPGFDVPGCSEVDVLRDIVARLGFLYREQHQLAGIVYCHRITDVRVTGSTRRSFEIFKSLCGKDAYGGATLLTTMWDALPQEDRGSEIGRLREESLLSNDHFWGDVKSGGGYTAAHTGDRASAVDIASKILARDEPITMAIQKEMVDRQEKLEYTTVGAVLLESLVKELKIYFNDLSDIEEELEGAKSNQKEELYEKLMLQKREIQARLFELEEKRSRLDVVLNDVLSEHFPGYLSQIERVERLEAQLNESRELAAHEDMLRRRKLEKELEDLDLVRQSLDEDRRRTRNEEDEMQEEINSLKRQLTERERMHRRAEREEGCHDIPVQKWARKVKHFFTADESRHSAHRGKPMTSRNLRDRS